MKCKICGKEAGKIFETKVLNKYDVSYYFCSNCEHLQTQEPFWLDEAYESPINVEDTGILRRNLDATIATLSVIFSFYDINAKYLDFAGGYGLFVRLMRDEGIDFVWEDKYAQNLFARCFEYTPDDKIEMITAFEVMEHIHDPMAELEKMFNISSEVFFSQTLISNPPPSIKSWNYYAPSHGQHISFYSKKTLDYIASVFNKKVFSCSQYHLFTDNDFNPMLFDKAICDSGMIYAKNASRLISKIGSDMEYAINKKAGCN